MDPELDLHCLPRIALLQIFTHLRVAPDVLALSSSSSLLRDVGAESTAWKSLCEAKWGPDGLNEHVCPHLTDATCDYKALYLSANGWRRPLRACASPGLFHPREGGRACAVAAGPDGAAHLVTLPVPLTGAIYSSNPTPGTFQIYPRAIIDVVHPPAWLRNASAALSWIDPEAGLFAMGDVCGGVHLIHKDLNDRSPGNRGEVGLTSYHGHGLAGSDFPVTCLQPHAASSSVAALWDRGEAAGYHPHAQGGVKLLDVAAPGAAAAVGVKGAMAEVFDHYALCTITSIEKDGGGWEWCGGSVKLAQDRADGDGVCPRCHPALPASLCHHQNRSSQAALIFFDIRGGEGPGAVVARQPLPHRSLFPRIETAHGGNILLLSSAGAPLTAWDRRKLAAGPVAAPSLVVPGNAEERRTEAMCLSVHGGTVAGRTDDGWIGVWDLETLLASDKGSLMAPATTVAVQPVAGNLDDAKPPRTEVWLGPDWVVANTGAELRCFRLEPRGWGNGAGGGGAAPI